MASRTPEVQNIEVTDAGRGWASGLANVDGQVVSWEAYRKDDTAIRVMLAQNGFWVQPNTLTAVRLAVEPTARRAMK